MADQKQAPIYPDNVEFAKPPSDTKEARKTTAYKRFEAFCRGELKAKNRAEGGTVFQFSLEMEELGDVE